MGPVLESETEAVRRYQHRYTPPGEEAEGPAETATPEAAGGAPTGEAGPAGEVSPDRLVLTVDELHGLCQGGRQSVDARFTGKTLRVTGVVGRVHGPDIVENPLVILTSAGQTPVRSVLCLFAGDQAEAVSRLTTGQKVTVEGRYDSCTINVLITDCVLVDRE